MAKNGLIIRFALLSDLLDCGLVSRQLQTQTDDLQAACAVHGSHSKRLTKWNPSAQSLARAQRQRLLDLAEPLLISSDVLWHARPGSSLPVMSTRNRELTKRVTMSVARKELEHLQWNTAGACSLCLGTVSLCALLHEAAITTQLEEREVSLEAETVP